MVFQENSKTFLEQKSIFFNILGIGLQIENDDKNESNQIFRLQENSNYLKNPKSCKICSF
jgi:hypothetical protein